MISHDAVLDLLAKKGPSVPSELKEELGEDIIIISALLTDLVEKKKICKTKAKWGNSPLYYLPMHLDKTDKLFTKIGPKEQRAFALIHEYKVLREDAVVPELRETLSQLEDFAVKILVQKGLVQTVFYKWFLLPDLEATELIKKTFAQPLPTELLDAQPIKQEQQPTIQKPSIVRFTPMDPSRRATNRPGELLATVSPMKAETPTQVDPYTPTAQQKELISQQIPHTLVLDEEPVKVNKQKEHTTQITLEQTPKGKKKLLDATTDPFAIQVTLALNKKSIEIISTTLIKEEAEVDVIGLIPSAAGKIRSYIKIKNKKKSSETDIQSAFVKGKLLNLTTVYASFGDITKKAQEEMHKDLSSVTYLKLE